MTAEPSCAGPDVIYAEMLCDDDAVTLVLLSVMAEASPDVKAGPVLAAAKALTSELRRNRWALVKIPELPEGWDAEGPLWVPFQKVDGENAAEP